MLYVLLNACEMVYHKFVKAEINETQVCERLEGILIVADSGTLCETIGKEKKIALEERISHIKNRMANPGQG